MVNAGQMLFAAFSARAFCWLMVTLLLRESSASL